MNTRTLVIGVLALLALYIASDAIYTVQAHERALLLRFGAVSRADIAPGLHFKLPIAEEVKKFDGRVQTLDPRFETYFTVEKKPLIVDSFVKWRIRDVERFYMASGGIVELTGARLQERVNTGLRNQISRRDMHEVISGERDKLMSELTAELDKVAGDALGVQVLDVRIKRVDLPSEVSEDVYRRMASEREILARQHRASGQELALGIRADADRQVVVIGAEAYRESEELKGDGDARSASIYADAFNADPEFYAFYRSLNAYRNTFSNKGDMLLLDPDSDFFKYLGDIQGKGR
ncbi:MAG: protease modulator HflC [Pseudomonadales bacterium]